MTRADAVWLETLRRLSPERKLKALFEAWEFGFSVRVAGVKLRFPGFTKGYWGKDQKPRIPWPVKNKCRIPYYDWRK